MKYPYKTEIYLITTTREDRYFFIVSVCQSNGLPVFFFAVWNPKRSEKGGETRQSRDESTFPKASKTRTGNNEADLI